MVEGNPQGKTKITGESGGFVEPVYTVRRMKMFPVQESELKHISGLNMVAMFSFSVAAGFFGLALSIWLEVAFSGKPVEGTIAELIANYGPLFFVIISVCAAIVGIIAVRTRGSIIDTIKSESCNDGNG